jgi:hypothetical protein
VGELFFALSYALSDPAQHSLPLKRRQPSRRAESLDRSRNCGLGVLVPSPKHAADNAAIVGCSNLDRLAVFNPFTIEKKSVGCDWSCNQLGHNVVLAPPHKQ